MPTSASIKTKRSRKPAPARASLSLTVQYVAEAMDIPTRTHLRRWVKAATQRAAEITVRFVDEPEGRALNRDYRGKDCATNVLSFVYAQDPIQGDLVICVPVVVGEAARQRITATAHYAHLVVHGVLHLQGFDHETEAEACVMEAREVEILTRLGFSDPYAGEA